MSNRMSNKELETWMQKKKAKLDGFVIVKPIDDVIQVKDNVVTYSPIKVIDKKEGKPKQPIVKNTTDKIHPEVRLLLYTILLHLDKTITEIYEIAHLAFSTGNKRKEQAIKEGLLEEFSTVIKKGRGSTAKFLSITAKGYCVLGLPKKEKARGGADHSFWILKVKDFYKKKGYRVSIEKYLENSNGFVDLLAERDEERIAIEVCLNKTNLEEIIHKLNSDSFTQRILCFQTDRIVQSQKKILLKKFSEEEVEKFEFKPLYEFF